MKHLKHLLAALVLVSLVIFTNCGGGGGGGKEDDPTDIQGDKLAKTWTLNANGASLGNPGTPVTEWNSFTLTIVWNGATGTYSTTNVAPDSEVVWPASGTWEFDGDDIGTVLRSDGVAIDIFTLTNTLLTLKFNIPAPTRTSSTSGDWSFSFTSPA